MRPPAPPGTSRWPRASPTATEHGTTSTPASAELAQIGDQGPDPIRICLVVGGDPAFRFACEHGLPVQTYLRRLVHPRGHDRGGGGHRQSRGRGCGLRPVRPGVRRHGDGRLTPVRFTPRPVALSPVGGGALLCPGPRCRCALLASRSVTDEPRRRLALSLRDALPASADRTSERRDGAARLRGLVDRLSVGDLVGPAVRARAVTDTTAVLAFLALVAGTVARSGRSTGLRCGPQRSPSRRSWPLPRSPGGAVSAARPPESGTSSPRHERGRVVTA